jgi:uncharacterized protein YgiM (DUF1202 family)
MHRKKAIIALALALTGATLALAADQAMSVAVREGQVRGKPSFLAPVVKTLPYGQQVQAGQPQGAWLPVTADGASGWMHLSALTEKKIVLDPGAEQAKGGASKEELALAGKGFNKDVEADFKSKNKEANFELVDKMEKRPPVAQAQITAFLKAGGVTPPAGGAQ